MLTCCWMVLTNCSNSQQSCQTQKFTRYHFVYLGDKTKVTTVFDAEKMNPVEMQQSGWQSILDNFKKYVETKKG